MFPMGTFSVRHPNQFNQVKICQYITNNNNVLYTSTASSYMEPIVWNVRVYAIPPRSISIISVQALTEQNAKHLFQLDDLT